MTTIKSFVSRLAFVAVIAMFASSAAAPSAKDGFDGPIPACWPICR